MKNKKKLKVIKWGFLNFQNWKYWKTPKTPNFIANVVNSKPITKKIFQNIYPQQNIKKNENGSILEVLENPKNPSFHSHN